MKIQKQPRLAHGVTRIPAFSSLHPKIQRHVEAEAKRYQCSKSFVIAVALADTFNIDIDRYDQPRRSKS